MRVASLRISSWVGLAPFAQHYQGVINFEGQDFDVWHPMTAAEAVVSNKYKRDNGMPMSSKPGERCIGMLSKQDVLEAAKRLFADKVQPLGAELLLLGDKYDSGPRDVVACSPSVEGTAARLQAVANDYRPLSWENVNDRAPMSLKERLWDGIIDGKEL